MSKPNLELNRSIAFSPECVYFVRLLKLEWSLERQCVRIMNFISLHWLRKVLKVWSRNLVFEKLSKSEWSRSKKIRDSAQF